MVERGQGGLPYFGQGSKTNFQHRSERFYLSISVLYTPKANHCKMDN